MVTGRRFYGRKSLESSGLFIETEKYEIFPSFHHHLEERNHIEALKDRNGNWFTDKMRLQLFSVGFFNKLFKKL